MAKRKVEFVENELYHICGRGVDGRTIFLDEQDYFRAIHDIYEFNDKHPTANIRYRTPLLQSLQFHAATPRERLPIIEILAFTLLPNHYHLLLRQLAENGIKNFMHKLGTGYASYFNQKYQRSGGLFQRPFKAVLVEKQAHFIHLPFYIHANPLDLKFPTWRERKLKDPQKAMEFLENYQWSSFPDYIGKKNFPSVTQRDFLTKVIGGPKEYKKTTLELLQEMDLGIIHDVALEDTNATP
ncbi:MAG: hypothetical protein A3C07_00900 [Candidatus Sungbacteria bacterium RIFCSPHIGHO2_02_FULL_47_11]|uniref:Transposase IS200-like domain-containing protein n=1 Tax=Candidatus Sungbacteria bacterium RIFCSPHIGHO2_02_FULL_47_11 TaxID=1802270 RepID=A0A1G2KNL2_9BACT|nr:MAG: hypothetical protein A3C07_00900 [Candidatus Sungbacteria bacterium RIFCSPHIGHO2_02_FULL_47_11]